MIGELPKRLFFLVWNLESSKIGEYDLFFVVDLQGFLVAGIPSLALHDVIARGWDFQKDVILGYLISKHE